jgi:hypothetical protein
MPATAHADLALGILSFDEFILGAPGSPGVNAFNIANFSGDPAMGGNALPPTFPVLTSVTFLDSSLALVSDGVITTLSLGDIGPGFFSSAALEFPDTQHFSSAVFSATLDTTTFLLADGSNVTVTSPHVITSLLPGSSDTLAAGADFALINASTAGSATPEPSSLILLTTVSVIFFYIRRLGTAPRIRAR